MSSEALVDPKISIIICNVNTKDILRLCLENLNGIYPNMEVFVVDNASVDGSVEMVSEIFPWVNLIKSGNNGLAVAFNLGLKNATGDYILYLGTDAFPKKGSTIEGLIEYFRNNPQAGAATVKLTTRDGNIDMDCHRSLPTPWVSISHFLKLDKLFPKSKLFAKYFLTYLDMDSVHEIGMTIAHFLFIRKDVQDKVGLWDEQFFLYGEDVDMCYRIQEQGYKLMYLGNLSAEHWKGVSVGRKESKDQIKTQGEVIVKGQKMSRSDFYVFLRKCSSDAMRIFYKKHLSEKYPRVLTSLVLLAVDFQEKIRIYQWKKFYSKL